MDITHYLDLETQFNIKWAELSDIYQFVLVVSGWPFMLFVVVYKLFRALQWWWGGYS